MENFALTAVVEELKTVTGGMVVRRIVQHHRNVFLLQTRSVRIPALKLSIDARNPIVYVSGERPPVETVTTDFLMILRKHLVSAHLLEIDKALSERIVELKFKTALPAQELETVFLIAELLPNAPNLFLLDRDRNILGSAVAPGTHRGMSLYEPYAYPNTNKTDLALMREDDRSWFSASEFTKDPKNWLIRNIAGIGPLFAAEIVYRLAAAKGNPPDTQAASPDVIDEIKDMIDRLFEPSSTAWAYSQKPFSVILERNDIEELRKVILTPIELESLVRKTHGVQSFPGMLEATRIVSDELESRILLEQAKSPRIRRVRDRLRRLGHQHKRLLDRQRRYSEANGLQNRGQMLVASGIDMDRHHQKIEVTDYFGDDPVARTIDLDPTKTVRENVNKMFKQYKKAGRGMEMVRTQLSKLESTRAGLEAEADRIRSICSWDEWTALPGATVARRSNLESRKAPRPNARRRRSIQLDGHEVLVGRNSRENDELTFKVATGEDFWFHVAGYTGSHVIVRNPAKETEPEASLLVRAAQLAAYYSQARNSNRVEVHYTRRKFVSKPRKAKPGLVRLREFKTVTVEPRDWTRLGPDPGTVRARAAEVDD